MSNNYHHPVLLKESVEGLNIKEDGVYVDITFGGGGHSREILTQLGQQGKLIAFDQDEDSQNCTIEDERFVFISQNFRYLQKFLRFYNIRYVDGILGDFGVSSHQLDQPKRGFSTRFEGVLDMRMNQNSTLSAQDVVNEYSLGKLSKILLDYGELRNAKVIARTIIEARETQHIATTTDLKLVLKKVVPNFKEHKILARIYQAIRIEVNEELKVIKEFLAQTLSLLRKGGRLSLISYHSLEDRLVKRFIKNGKFEGEAEKDFYGNLKVEYKFVEKLICPSKEEIKWNHRARSAKLRIAERV